MSKTIKYPNPETHSKDIKELEPTTIAGLGRLEWERVKHSSEERRLQILMELEINNSVIERATKELALLPPLEHKEVYADETDNS